MALPTGSYQGQDLINFNLGNKFLPRDYYSLNPYKAPLPTSETETVTQTYGIPYTGAFTGGGGGGGSPMSGGQNISDFQSAINKRQENLQNPSKIANFIGDYIPQQRSVVDMMRSGVKDVRATKGIPFGIGSMINKMMPDKYYQMPVGDQTFIQSQMGYSDPQTNMANKDPFGINVRSMFGNYADYVTEEADKLEKIVADQKKRGLTDTLQMKKLRYYKPLRMKRQNIQSDVGLIEKGKAAAAEQHQAQQQQMEQDRQGGQNPSAQSFRSAPGGLSQKQSREARGDPKGTGGGWKWAEGGRIGFQQGGWNPGVGRDAQGYQSNHPSATPNNNSPVVVNNPVNNTNPVGPNYPDVGPKFNTELVRRQIALNRFQKQFEEDEKNKADAAVIPTSGYEVLGGELGKQRVDEKAAADIWEEYKAQGGRIGYRNGEFVDENINVEGPNFDVNENVEMAEGPSPFEMRIDELMDEGLSWEEAYNIAAQEFSSAEGPEESLSQEGIASIV